MTAPLSQDLCKRLVRAVKEGASAREAAARFAVSASAAIKLVRPDGVYKLMRAYARRIGAHVLRATAATNTLDHDADIAKVQE